MKHEINKYICMYTFIDTSISTDIYTNDHQLHLLQLVLLILPERASEQV